MLNICFFLFVAYVRRNEHYEGNTEQKNRNDYIYRKKGAPAFSRNLLKKKRLISDYVSVSTEHDNINIRDKLVKRTNGVSTNQA